ncbi:MAG: hypothetical protein ABL995_12715 [Bryobacteraceae bacterium]
MRYCLLTLVTASLAFAQATSTNYQPDLNGRLVEGNRAAVGPKGDRTELSDSMNGRKVPREVTETRILSEGPSGRVTETITRKFDPTGQPGLVTRTVTESQVKGNATTTRSTTYVSDVNGRMQEGERRTIESVKQGNTTTSEVGIARPGPTGSFDTVEKRKVVSVADEKAVHEDETVYRPAQNTGFVAAEREIRDTKKDANGASTTKQSYTPGNTGQLELMAQEVIKTQEKPDGSSVTERNIYRRSTDGVAVSSDTGQRLRAQEILVRAKTAGDGVVETLSVREPSPGDPGRLGAARKVSETVCTGKCGQ